MVTRVIVLIATITTTGTFTLDDRPRYDMSDALQELEFEADKAERQDQWLREQRQVPRHRSIPCRYRARKAIHRRPCY